MSFIVAPTLATAVVLAAGWASDILDGQCTVGADKNLICLAREEVPQVIHQIKKKLYGGRHCDMAKIDAVTCLKAWLDPQLLGHFKTFINTNLVSDPASNSDITAFVRVLIYFILYHINNIAS